MKKHQSFTCIFALTAMLTLTHCADTVQTATGDYNSADVGKVTKVAQGVIVSERLVNVYNKTPEANADLNGNIDTSVTRRQGYEYVIKLDSGTIVSLVQTENLNLKPKQRILVIYGATTRIVPDEGTEN